MDRRLLRTSSKVALLDWQTRASHDGVGCCKIFTLKLIVIQTRQPRKLSAVCSRFFLDLVFCLAWEQLERAQATLTSYTQSKSSAVHEQRPIKKSSFAAASTTSDDPNFREIGSTKTIPFLDFAR